MKIGEGLLEDQPRVYTAATLPDPTAMSVGTTAILSGAFAADVTSVLLTVDYVKGVKSWTGNVYSENDAPANPSVLGIPDGVTWVKLS